MAKYLIATNGTYSYIGNDSIIKHNTQLYGNSGIYIYIGINSTSGLFIGDWEYEFNPSDTWTAQSVAVSAWQLETTAINTWVDESNTTSTWIDEISPLTTWN
jgi:hypothetical protein